jgi:hypothetical protein
MVHIAGSMLAHSLGPRVPATNPLAYSAPFSTDRIDAGPGIQVYWRDPHAAIPDRAISVAALINRFSLIYLQFNKKFAA